MIEHQPNIYPNTAFVDEVAHELHPRAVDLVRGVYNAVHFGQMDQSLTTGFASTIARHEANFWLPPEIAEYDEIFFSASRFFEGTGAEDLARASMPKRSKPSELTESVEVQHAKKSLLEDSWHELYKNRPDRAALDNGPGALETIRLNGDQKERLARDMALRKTEYEEGKSLKEIRQEFKDHVFLPHVHSYLRFRDFVAVDLRNIREGRPIGTYEHDPHESMTREAVLYSANTGNLPFNDEFWNWQMLVTSHVMKPEMKQLENAWKVHNKGSFAPDQLATSAIMPFPRIFGWRFRNYFKAWQAKQSD